MSKEEERDIASGNIFFDSLRADIQRAKNLDSKRLFSLLHEFMEKPEAAERPVKRRKRKKHPRIPFTAEMVFVTEQRPIIVEAHPNLSFTAVAKMIGERWKALSDSDRAYYEHRALEDKVRYEDECKRLYK